MKKALSLILSIIMVFSISAVAFAAEDDFRPSVDSKDHPVIVFVKDKCIKRNTVEILRKTMKLLKEFTS